MVGIRAIAVVLAGMLVTPAAAPLAAAPFPVDPSGAGTQSAAAIGADRTGRYVVAWEDDIADGDGSGIVARRFDAVAGALDDPFAVTVTTAGDQRQPAVAMRDDGGFVVVWESAGQDGDGLGVYARVFDASGAATSGEVRINAVSAGDQGAPDVAVGASGSFFVVWESDGQDGSGFGVYGRFLDASGQISGADLRLADVTAGDQRTPAIDAVATGDFVVLWEDDDRIFGRRYEGGFFAPSDLQVPGLPSGVPHRRPRVALRDDGSFLAGWWSNYSLAGFGDYVVRAMSASDQAVGDPQIVELPFGSAWPVTGDLAADPSSTAFAVVSSGTSDSIPKQVNVRRFPDVIPSIPLGIVAVDPHEPQGAIARLGGPREDFVAAWSETAPSSLPRVVVFLVPRFHDGFEIGGTDAWSITVP